MEWHLKQHFHFSFLRIDIGLNINATNRSMPQNKIKLVHHYKVNKKQSGFRKLFHFFDEFQNKLFIFKFGILVNYIIFLYVKLYKLLRKNYSNPIVNYFYIR